MSYVLDQKLIERNDQGQVTFVGFPLTPEEWFSCCARTDSSEGYYLGGCCGNLSAAQDILSGWLRMNPTGLRVFDIRRSMAEFHDLVRNHDGYNTKDLPDLALVAGTDPIARLLLVYETVKDSLEPSRGGDRPYAAPYDSKDIRTAMDVLRTNAKAVSWDLFADKSEVPSHMTRAWRTERVRELLPAITTVYRHLTDLHLGDFEGWTIVDQSGALCQTSHGAAVCETEKEAQMTAKEWSKSAAEERGYFGVGKDIPERLNRTFRVVPCRVSLADGVVVVSSDNGALSAG